MQQAFSHVGDENAQISKLWTAIFLIFLQNDIREVYTASLDG